MSKGIYLGCAGIVCVELFRQAMPDNFLGVVSMQLYLRLLGYARPYIPYMVASVVCMIILSATTSAIAYLVKPAIDEVFLKRDYTMLVVIPILTVIAYLVKGLSDYGQSYLMGAVGNRVVTDLRARLYEHIQRMSLSFFTKTSTGLLMSRIANDVGILQRATSDSLKKILENAFLIIGLSGVALYQNWRMALFCLVLLPVAAFPIKRFGKQTRRYSKKSQERMASISTFLDETISGNQTIKSFCLERFEIERFFKETERLLHVGLNSLKVGAYSTPVMELIGGIIGAVIIYYGGYNVIKGTMTPGEFFSFIAAVAMLYRPVKGLSRENMKVQKGLAAAARVFELLDTVPDVQDKPGAITLPRFSEAIEFRNVSFSYEDRMVLKDVSFTARAGEVVAIVGHSGAGKTTIANLLLRFYDVTEGAICIDGYDIRDVTVRSLRQQIAFVSQETVLFNDTIRNNITYGSLGVPEENIIAAAKAAYAHDFIMALPEGYDTVVGEKGMHLSGGQRQRIAVARALVKNAPILILDEATSALDAHSEQQVQKALERLMVGRTTILIAHRLATVRNADTIIVLQDGEIIERGTHEDLLAQQGVYQRLIEIQSGYVKQPAPPAAHIR
ncbi:MAG: lipid A export permease/ATP-binding protein MsbA [Desulfobacterota bacterium]|nr:lipid A export permease/ATP-binding protein MsbA [Thermodesulfobacteriota bacterium]